MIWSILKKSVTPVMMVLCLRRYGGIWGLKRHLLQSEAKNDWLLQTYDSYFSKYGSWIGFSSKFEDVPCFPHLYYGIFISGQATIGKNCVIFQQVTIGSNTLNSNNFKSKGSPVIGNNVYIGAGAKIIGNIIIGDNCRIGANAVVYEDMPPNCVAVQAHTRIIQKSALDNRYYINMNGKWCYYLNGNWIDDETSQT